MSDKRTVSTDALETLGTIIDDKAGRDAIHLAVEPAIAAQRLYPGQDVGFTGGEAMASANPVGIVDPFLKAPVQVGERFWLVVYPRQITSLRHVWEHPAFPESSKKSAEKTDKEKSEEWLRHWCDTNDVPAYESIIEGLLNSHGGDDYGHVVHQGEYLLSHGSEAHAEIPNEFWDHIEIVTGKVFPRATHFSCSC